MAELTPYLQDQKRKSEELLQRQRDLCAKLVAQGPEELIHGLVRRAGSDIFNPGSLLDRWTFIFTLDGWTDSEGTLHREEVTVRKVVDESELRILEEAIRAGSVVSLRVHLGNLEGFKPKQAALIEVMESGVEDKPLEQFARELATPVTVQSEIFGCLRLDRQSGWFEGTTRWGLRKIRIGISPKDLSDPSPVLAMAEEFWAKRKELSQAATAFAAGKLLEVRNEGWLEEGESPVTAKEFTRRMKLESITVREDGEFDFWFKDGELFWGHSIEVRGDLKRGFFDASIQG